RDRRRPVAELRLDPLRAGGHAPAHGDAATCQGGARPDDDGVRARVGRERVERLGGSDAEAAPLAGGEVPVAAVRSDRPPRLVDDGAWPVGQARAAEEGAVVVAAEEARLL